MLFGYYFLIEPLKQPIAFILSADYECWTPYTGTAGNPECPERYPYCARGRVGVAAVATRLGRPSRALERPRTRPTIEFISPALQKKSNVARR